MLIPFGVKFGMLCFVVALAMAIGHVARQGRLLNAGRGNYNALVFETHKEGTSGVLWFMLVIIVTIEWAVQKYGLKHSTLFWVHLPFAVIWATTFIAMKAHFNGRRYPGLHNILAYAGIFCAVVAGTLGTFMVVFA